MNVLVVCVPASGHVQPLLPLVASLVGGGDHVVVATGDDPGRAIAATGAEFSPAGHGEMEWFSTLGGHIRGTPGDGLAPGRINHYFVPRLFGEVAAADMIDDVVACGRRLDPDVVLFETYALAGPLAARVLGVPGVHLVVGQMLSPEVMELANDAVSPLWRSMDLDAPRYAGVYDGLTLETSPPALRVRPVPAGESLDLRAAPVPRRPVVRSDPDLVYVTLGTFFAGNVPVFRAILDGLADEAVDVVVTVGLDQDPDALGRLPGNARAERFIPQDELLPSCSVVVHHGGSGTMFGSLAHGLPQVVVPQGADNFDNGDAIARAGVGTVIAPDELSAAAVRTAVRAVLRDPSYARAAGAVAAEMAAMPGPDDVAQVVRSRFGST